MLQITRVRNPNLLVQITPDSKARDIYWLSTWEGRELANQKHYLQRLEWIWGLLQVTQWTYWRQTCPMPMMICWELYVDCITYPFCALVKLLKTVHIFLHYTEIVTADCFYNRQYLYFFFNLLTSYLLKMILKCKISAPRIMPTFTVKVQGIRHGFSFVLSAGSFFNFRYLLLTLYIT